MRKPTKNIEYRVDGVAIKLIFDIFYETMETVAKDLDDVYTYSRALSKKIIRFEVSKVFQQKSRVTPEYLLNTFADLIYNKKLILTVYATYTEKETICKVELMAHLFENTDDVDTRLKETVDIIKKVK